MKYPLQIVSLDYGQIYQYTMQTEPFRGRVAAISLRFSRGDSTPLAYIRFILRRKLARFLWASRKSPK